MILATHNSLSYLKPQWWLRPFSWIGRCQSLTIEQQLAYGVRYFDIRVKICHNRICSGHGLLTYKIEFGGIGNFLHKIRLEKGCIVRLTLENKKATEEQKDSFKTMCECWKFLYSNITFVGGYQKGTWEHLYDFGNNVDVIEFYWTFSKKSWFPFPLFYAKKYNKWYKWYKGSNYLMLDFVQL